MAAEQAAAAWPAPPPFQSRDPPAPVDGEFTMFGVARTTGPPVAPQLEEQVYSDATEQRCEELRRLNRSLLQSFLQLTQLMARSPSQCSEKVADLRTLFLNFEHLLNTFRPHEAREELIAIVKQQAEAKRQLADELDAARAEAAAGVAEGLRDPPAPPDALAPAAAAAMAAAADAPEAGETRDEAPASGWESAGAAQVSSAQTWDQLLRTLEGVP